MVVVALATAVLSPVSGGSTVSQPSFPIRAVFYYPWYPEAWRQHDIYPYTNFRPTLGYYDGTRSSVIAQHIRAMRYARIQAGIVSWWGRGTRSDQRMPLLLRAAAETPFRWTIYYEKEAYGDPSATTIRADLAHIRDQFASQPAYLRIGGKFVVFVYASGTDACSMATRWKNANTVGAYVVLKVFHGYRTCTSQPQGWHNYSAAVRTDDQSPYGYSISPGFWQYGRSVRLSRDLTSFRRAVRSMVASGARFQLITTFNEWGEGTGIESARGWQTTSGYGSYLDALHNNGL